MSLLAFKQKDKRRSKKQKMLKKKKKRRRRKARRGRTWKRRRRIKRKRRRGTKRKRKKNNKISLVSSVLLDILPGSRASSCSTTNADSRTEQSAARGAPVT